MGASEKRIELRALQPGDLGWVIQRQATLYAREYGWNQEFESLLARICADYVDHLDPARENAWIAEIDGVRAGAIFCVKKDEETAQLRMLFVEPSARGLGVGSKLVETCLAFAKNAGYRTITLWSNDVLTSARRIYVRAGFKLIEEEPYRGYGHDLVGQIWSREL